MQYSQYIMSQTPKHTPQHTPKTIRKRVQSPYDRHILKIDRLRYEMSSSSSTAKSASSYHSTLEDTFLKRQRVREFALQLTTRPQTKEVKLTQHGRKSEPMRIFRVAGWRDDYYSSLLDWSHNDFIFAARQNQLLTYNMTSEGELEDSLYRRYNFQRNTETINSIKCSPTSLRVALGHSAGYFKCFDYYKEKTVFMQRMHSKRVTVLDWYGNNIYSGSKDSCLKSIDCRSFSQSLKFPRSHIQEICSIKANGNLVASGGNDNFVQIYDIRKTNMGVANYEHEAAVGALEWIQPNTLLSGGGTNDRKLKFWKDGIGVYRVVDTGSQICAIASSMGSQEIVTCQGYSLNQIILWSRQGKRIMTIHGHASRVLFCARSPQGEYIATGAGDQKLKVWKLFKRATKNEWSSEDIR